jgi:hypothetical protein
MKQLGGPGLEQRVVLVVALATGLSVIADYLVGQVGQSMAQLRIPNNSFVEIHTGSVSGWLVLVVWGGAFVVWGAGSWLLLKRRAAPKDKGQLS